MGVYFLASMVLSTDLIVELLNVCGQVQHLSLLERDDLRTLHYFLGTQHVRTASSLCCHIARVVTFVLPGHDEVEFAEADAVAPL